MSPPSPDGCILDRLLSIRNSRAVGYRVASLWQVLNTVLCEKEPEKLAWQSLYLTALKVYPPQLRSDHQDKVEEWRETVLIETYIIHDITRAWPASSKRQ